MHGQALALSNTIRMPLVLILSKRRMRFLLGHSRIPLRHLHILMTEHLADGLHRHTCLQRNEAGERVSSRMKGDINKKAIYEPICKSRRLPKVLISWFYHAEYS